MTVVHAVIRSMVARIRLKSRMWYWHDLDTAEIWSKVVRLLSKMTPRLWAQSTGERMTSLSEWLVGGLSFSSSSINTSAEVNSSCSTRIRQTTTNSWWHPGWKVAWVSVSVSKCWKRITANLYTQTRGLSGRQHLFMSLFHIYKVKLSWRTFCRTSFITISCFCVLLWDC